MTTRTSSPPANLKANILAAVAANPAPTRRRFRALKAGATALAIAALAVGYVALGGIHWSDRPAGFVVGVAAGWVGLAIWATWRALWPGRSMVPRADAFGWAWLIASPLLLLGWSGLWNLRFPETTMLCKGRVGFVCLDLSLTLGVAPLLLFVFLWRGTAPVGGLQRGLMLGGAVGAWTAVLIHLGCECSDLRHVALGHVLPLVLLAGAGAYLGARVLRRPVALT